MWSRLFLTSLCLLSVLAVRPLTAANTNTDIQFQIEHQIDHQCDGTPDAAAKAIPSSCIIYSVTAINTSGRIYRDVSVTAHIPKHTTLVQGYRYQDSQRALPSKTSRSADGLYLIETQLDVLPPGEDNKVSVSYSVKIR